jgi:hypothetical protein
MFKSRLDLNSPSSCFCFLGLYCVSPHLACFPSFLPSFLSFFVSLSLSLSLFLSLSLSFPSFLPSFLLSSLSLEYLLIQEWNCFFNFWMFYHAILRITCLPFILQIFITHFVVWWWLVAVCRGLPRHPILGRGE